MKSNYKPKKTTTMKNQKTYGSREEFERKNPYVAVETPYYEGKKCGIAQITGQFATKKAAENNTQGEKILTRKQAEAFISRWNSEYKNGNMGINF